MPSVVIGPSRCRLILRQMNVIGDLERLFATSLYPLRIPIAIAVGLAGVGVIVLARRRGWVAAAGRHPRRSGHPRPLQCSVSSSPRRRLRCSGSSSPRHRPRNGRWSLQEPHGRGRSRLNALR